MLKHFNHLLARTAVQTLMLVGLAAGLAGCKPSQDKTANEQAPIEIRGEPINSPKPPAEPAPGGQVAAANAVASPVPEQAPPAGTASAIVPAQSSDDSKPGGYASTGFDKLSAFEFELTDDLLNPPAEALEKASAKSDSLIPAEVKGMNKKRVFLQGFMLPLKVEGGLVTELLLMKDQSMCCYGTVPRINEWISVTMVGGGVKPIMDQVITLFGILHVGEIRENGYLVGIYRMEGDKMDAPAEN